VIDLAAASPSVLALVRCPLCGENDAEPVAVGRDFDHDTLPDSLLAVRCGKCGLVYLNPAPVPEVRDRLYPAAYFASPELAADRRRASRAAARAAMECCRGLPESARLLELAYGDSLHLEILHRMAPPTWTFGALTPHSALAGLAREAGFPVHIGTAAHLSGNSRPYDCVLLLHALEHCASPVRELQSLSALLAPGGRIVIVAHNADSAASHAFQGRHWAGYDFPRHAALFGPSSLRRLAEKAGYDLDQLRMVSFSRTWTRSAATFLSDWPAPAWLRHEARRGGILATGLGAAAEATLGRREGAAWMAAVLLPRTEALR